MPKLRCRWAQRYHPDRYALPDAAFDASCLQTDRGLICLVGRSSDAHDRRGTMRIRSVVFVAACVLIATATHLAAAADAHSTCEVLKNMELDHAAVVSAKWVEAGPMEVQLRYPTRSVHDSISR